MLSRRTVIQISSFSSDRSSVGAYTVACYTLVNFVVVDLRIQHSLDSSFIAKLGIINFATRLDEFSLSLISDGFPNLKLLRPTIPTPIT